MARPVHRGPCLTRPRLCCSQQRPRRWWGGTQLAAGAQEPGDTAAGEAASVSPGAGPRLSSRCLSVCLLPACLCPALCAAVPVGETEAGWARAPLPRPPPAHGPCSLPELPAGRGGGDLLRSERHGGGQQRGCARGPAPGVHVQGKPRPDPQLAGHCQRRPGGGGTPVQMGRQAM